MKPRVTYEYESCEKCDGKGEITYERQLDVDEFKEWVEACGDCEGTGEVAVKAITEITVRVEDDLKTRHNWPKVESSEELAADAVRFLRYGFKTNALTEEGYIGSVVEAKPEVIEVPKEARHAELG